RYAKIAERPGDSTELISKFYSGMFYLLRQGENDFDQVLDCVKDLGRKEPDDSRDQRRWRLSIRLLICASAIGRNCQSWNQQSKQSNVDLRKWARAAGLSREEKDSDEQVLHRFCKAMIRFNRQIVCTGYQPLWYAFMGLGWALQGKMEKDRQASGQTD